MNAVQLTTRRRNDLRAALLLAGLAAAVVLRVLIAGSAGAQSVSAGLGFGLALLLLAVATGFERPVITWRAVGLGLAGAAVLCAVPAVHRLQAGALDLPTERFGQWAAVVTLVAVAEEVLLRGALFEQVAPGHGDTAATAVTAVAFALLHVPVYGWSVLPLDLAVGVALGVLRMLADSVTAPAVAHTMADLAGWFLR